MRYKDFIKNKYYFFYHFTFFDLKAFCFWYSKNQKVVDWMLSFFVSLYFPFTYEMLLYFSFYSWHVALFFLLLMTSRFIFLFTHDMLLYFSFYSRQVALFFLLLMTSRFIFLLLMTGRQGFCTNTIQRWQFCLGARLLLMLNLDI